METIEGNGVVVCVFGPPSGINGRLPDIRESRGEPRVTRVKVEERLVLRLIVILYLCASNRSRRQLEVDASSVDP